MSPMTNDDLILWETMMTWGNIKWPPLEPNVAGDD